MEKGDRIRDILIDQGSIGRETGKKISRYMDLTADDGVTRPAGTDETPMPPKLEFNVAAKYITSILREKLEPRDD